MTFARLIFSGLRLGTYGLASLGALLIGLRLAAPWPVDSHDADAASLAAAKHQLSGRPSTRVFVSIDGRDPAPQILTRLRNAAPALPIDPMSQRSNANDRCNADSRVRLTVGACKVDDFVAIEWVAQPLWGVAVVWASTAACARELTLIKLPTGWWSAFSRRVCS